MTTCAAASTGGDPSHDPEFTLFAVESPARATPSPANSSARRTNAGAGHGSVTSSMDSNRRSFSSRTSPTSCGPVSSMSSKTLPTVGSMRGGFVSPLPPLVHRTFVGDLSSLLPTPSASSYGTNQGGAAGRVGKVRPSLATMARHGLWPTPQASMGERGGRGDLHFAVTRGQVSRRRDWTADAPEGGWRVSRGLLNPTWIEWLMGLPMGWTEASSRPNCEPSGTP